MLLCSIQLEVMRLFKADAMSVLVRPEIILE